MKQLLVEVFLLFLLNSCVLKKDPIAPTLHFKTDAGYVSEGSSVDTSAFLKIGLEAQKSADDMRFLQVERKIDSTVTVLYSSVLTASSKSAFGKDFECKTTATKVIHTEQYVFKITDDNGFTFDKSISVKVDPNL